MTAKQWTERECTGEYQLCILAAAKILVAAGKSEWLYSTSYITGTTAWHKGAVTLMVKKDGTIT